MLLTTTSQVEGRKIKDYLGIVAGETILGANLVRDLFASITDVIGGRSRAYEKKLFQARETALREMAEEARSLGANAVVGISIDYEALGETMLMVTASGTAVYLE